ncbi:Ubiquinone/menaquinone biosynthesis C-methyltransferase UbiE [Candidatus Norongarragalina meridionalis]|nr:Ubiquinone/menaquinone biosynthesis C-methyltransferase UbiE [Candidatus Norongarragalina meridionalis]
MRAFDLIAEEWNGRRREPMPAIDLFLPLVPTGGVMMDAGCGNGRNARIIASRSRLLYCLDSSANMLTFARKNLRGLKNVKITRASVTKLPLPSASIDAAFYLAVLHLLNANQREKAFSEMRRVLRPGGKAFITVWNKDQQKFHEQRSKKEFPVMWKKEDGSTIARHYYFYTASELRLLAKKNGMRAESVFYELSGRKTEKKGAHNLCAVFSRA